MTMNVLPVDIYGKMLKQYLEVNLQPQLLKERKKLYLKSGIKKRTKVGTKQNKNEQKKLKRNVRNNRFTKPGRQLLENIIVYKSLSRMTKE